MRKQIPDYPGYSIDENGVAYRPNGKPLAITFGLGFRYPLIRISKDCRIKFFAIHQLVAELFIGPKPFPSAVVRHKDDNKLNYKSSNLEWGTRKLNHADAVRNGTRPNSGEGESNFNSKLTERDVLDIRFCLDFGAGIRTVAKAFNVSTANIFRIKHRRSWKNL